MQAQLQPKKVQTAKETESSYIAKTLIEYTRISHDEWKLAGQDMLEVVLPMQSCTVKHLFDRAYPHMDPSHRIAESMGLNRVSLIADFPITTAVYGFSRVDYQA